MCEGDDCSPSMTCRVDQFCEDGACVHWAQTALRADFAIRIEARRPDTVNLEVLPGGFPHELAEQIRFDLGDGTSGWGERVRHRYDAPGRYAIELEVRLPGGVVLRASKLAVIAGGTGNPLHLTLVDVPAQLNGSTPYDSNNGTPDDPSDDYSAAFHLLVPTHGFTIDVMVTDTIVRDSLRLTLNVASGSQPADSDLSGDLVFEQGETLEVMRARWLVPEGRALPVATATVTLSARTIDGTAYERKLAFETIELTAETDPFDRPMTWLFRFDMDLFTVTPRDDGGRLVLDVADGANGMPDFDEELAAIGARGPDEALNALYRRWFVRGIIERTQRYFGIEADGTATDGIAFTIVADDEPGAPDPSTFDRTGAFSMMRFGGQLIDVFGRSRFGPYNELRVDDTTADLGVGTIRLTQLIVGAPGLREEIMPLWPNVGQPVGTHSADATVLAPSFDRYEPSNPDEVNARHDRLRTVVDLVSLAVASVTAHEMGHAMGLVPNGPPPMGFFGGRGDVSFIGAENTDSHHADYPRLNLMQAGGQFANVVTTALSELEVPPDATLVDLFRIFLLENRLSAYSRGYLQGRLTYSRF